RISTGLTGMPSPVTSDPLVGHARNGRIWSSFPGYLTGRKPMPTPQREPLRRLSRAERVTLHRIASSTSERVDQVRRATALLAVARTGVFIHAAREAGLRSGTTVADLVARFNRHGLAAVRIARGRGRCATIPPAHAHRSSPPRSAQRTGAQKE